LYFQFKVEIDFLQIKVVDVIINKDTQGVEPVSNFIANRLPPR